MFFRFILMVMVCVTLYAQADRGTITGTVADPQGGIVPQAKVGLRNTQTGSDEQLSVGRSFRVREGIAFSFRGEFFNAFNRTVLDNPSSGNPTATTTTDSRGLSGGFGFINGLNSRAPRSGQVVLRLQF